MTELNSQWACESVKNAYRYLDCKVCRVAPRLPGATLSEFIRFFNRATVVSRVLFLTFKSFPKNAAKSAVGECLAEVLFCLFLKENKSSLLFPQRSALCFCVYVFPCCFSSLNMSKQPDEKNGREKSLCNEFKLSRNSNSFAETQIKIVPECLIS